MSAKDCWRCVYNGVCEDRKGNEHIVDCYIPAEPLRKLQQNAKTAAQYGNVTCNYIKQCKSRSVYWSRNTKDSNEW